VLELEDLEDRALDVDVVAVLELVRRNQINQSFLQAKSDVVAESPGRECTSGRRSSLA